MNKITLSTLQQIIKQKLDQHLDNSYWVTAEISELKVNINGHCYLELIEKDSNSQYICTKISATIWASTFAMLRSYFETSSGRSLQAGLSVLVKVNVQYHVLYGLSLNINDIEPSYTVGELLLQRRKTIQRLQSEGVFNMNREIEFPILPQRIAIISSKNAAGYQDFLNQLHNNNNAYTFTTSLFDAIMQGNTAESSIVSALKRINKQKNNFDLVVIIRGGGSQSDLSCFDSYNLAYYAAQFSLPILTGIGHDKDLSVLDMVAKQSFKTPTAVADFLISSINSLEIQLNNCVLSIKEFAHNYMNRQNNKIQELSNSLKNNVITSILKENVKLNDLLSSRMNSACKYALPSQEQKLKYLEMKLHANNPQRMLARGYSLTLYNGRIISSASEVNNGDCIETIFSDSKLVSIVNSSNN